MNVWATAPVVSNGEPNQTISTTSSTTISWDTDQSCTCRYDLLGGVDYDDMAGTVSSTGGTSHSTTVTVTDGEINRFHIKCENASLEESVRDYTLHFLVGTYAMPLGIPAPSFGITNTSPSLPSPWTSDVSGFYYVQAGGTNGNEGYPGDPRGSWPNPIPAGSVVCVNGSFSSYSPVNSPGTSGDPIFFRSYDNDDRATFTEKLILGATAAYTVVENINFDWSGASNGKLEVTAGGDHISVRNCDVIGNESANQIGFLVYNPASSYDSTDLVFFNNVITENGDWDFTEGDPDAHSISLGQKFISDVWILGNEFSYTSGNAVQIGAGSNGSIADTDVDKNIYVGHNLVHHIAQTGLWTKQADKVIFSENHCHTMREDHPTSPGSGGLGYQYGPSNVWFLFNEVHDSSNGIGIGGNSGGYPTDCYIIGNLFYDIHDEIGADSSWRTNAYSASGPGTAIGLWGVSDFYIIDNTFHDYDAGILCPGDMDVHLSGNIFSERNTGSDGLDVHLDYAASSTAHRNNFENPYFLWGDSTPRTSVSALETLLGASGTNNKEVDPAFVAEGSNDFRLTSGSQMVGANTEHAGYDQFYTNYTIDIEYDIAEVARPQGGTWDMGAFEFNAAPITILLIGEGAPLNVESGALMTVMGD